MIVCIVVAAETKAGTLEKLNNFPKSDHVVILDRELLFPIAGAEEFLKTGLQIGKNQFEEILAQQALKNN